MVFHSPFNLRVNFKSAFTCFTLLKGVPHFWCSIPIICFFIPLRQTLVIPCQTEFPGLAVLIPYPPGKQVDPKLLRFHSQTTPPLPKYQFTCLLQLLPLTLTKYAPQAIMNKIGTRKVVFGSKKTVPYFAFMEVLKDKREVGVWRIH